MKDALADQTSIQDLPEFDDHKFISFIYDEKTELEGFIAIHRSNSQIPSFGATRFWQYVTSTAALQDTLRLSKLMSYKSALAGLKCGGAKGVIIDKTGSRKLDRKKLFRAYADRVNFLGGHFITGTDVGVFQNDLRVMKKRSPYIVGFNDNSAFFTALGIFESIKICLKEIYGNTSFEGRSFAIQGLGKVGLELLRLVSNEMRKADGEMGKVYGADINSHVASDVKKKFHKLILVRPQEIHKQRVDVFCPCALSGSLNSRTISEMKAKIIAGSANNQLINENIGVLLYKLGILYAPDYVINAGGLMAVFDEYKVKQYREIKVRRQVLKIPDTLENILNRSLKEGKAPNIIANEMAEKIFNDYE